MPFIHKIEERTLDEVKSYHQPKTFLGYCEACPHYSKIWTCPPYDFDTKEVVEPYQFIYIIGSKLYLRDLGEEFRPLLQQENIESATSQIYHRARLSLDEGLIGMKEEYKDIKVLLAGRCLACNPCTRVEEQPCRYPEKMHFSLESIGYDVSTISEEVLGEKIQWATDHLPEYFLLVSAVLSKDQLDIEDLYNRIK